MACQKQFIHMRANLPVKLLLNEAKMQVVVFQTIYQNRMMLFISSLLQLPYQRNHWAFVYAATHSLLALYRSYELRGWCYPV